MTARNRPLLLLRPTQGLTEGELDRICEVAVKPRTFANGKRENKARARRRGLVDCALVRTLRDGLLLNQAGGLTWADIKRADDGTGRLYFLPWVARNVDREGKGVVLLLSKPTMKALGKILKFRDPDGWRGGFVFDLCTRQVSRRVKAALAAADIQARFASRQKVQPQGVRDRRRHR